MKKTSQTTHPFLGIGRHTEHSRRHSNGQPVMGREDKVCVADEALNFKYSQAKGVLECINDNIKQDQVHSARMLLLELSCIYDTISPYGLSFKLLN